MKIIWSLVLFAGVALGYSTSYYGWVPKKEFIYHFESQVLTGIPEIRSQYAGLKLSSKVRIQTFPDYSLRIQFVKPRFLTVNNQEIPNIDGINYIPSSLSSEEIPEAVRHPLVTPFEVHMKRGVVESLFVEKSEPVVVTNLKKALLAQLQTDLSGNREGSVQKLNHLVLPQVKNAQEEVKNLSFFRTMESSLTGDCETSYTLHPLPLHHARELEEQWRVHKVKVFKTLPVFIDSQIHSAEELLKLHREAELVCEGKQYWEIIKTKNFDNCRERPLYFSASGIKNRCDVSKSDCENSKVDISSTRYIVCGTPEQFTIRKAKTEQIISLNPSGWNTKEKMTSFSTVNLELLKVETSGFQPLIKPTDPKKLNDLIMEYPEHKTFSPRSIAQRMRQMQGGGGREVGNGYGDHMKYRNLTGFFPFHPMPELESSPDLIFPTSIRKPELYQQVRELMDKIVKQTRHVSGGCASPASSISSSSTSASVSSSTPSSSSSDIAGYLVSMAKALRPLNVQELKEVEAEIVRYVQIRQPSNLEESVKTAKYLYYDVLTMVGTNPSTVVIKSLVESEEIPRRHAPSIIQATIKNVKTPTPELLNMLLSLVKTTKTKSPQMYSVGLTSFSDLIYRACINPSSMVAEFPVHIYGNFCNPDTSFITEQYIPYLTSEIETCVRGTTKEKVTLIHALGKLGHYRCVTPLVKIIEGQISNKPMIRSMAVYSMKRIAKNYPTKVRPILLSMIDNLAEHPEVRIAAVSILPFTGPTSSELHKIALRTWFEPSKQVSSFIYSTLKSLARSEMPELLQLRAISKNILPMAKPVQSGIQFSHNLFSSKFVDYLKIMTNNKWEIVNSPDSLIPTKFSFKYNIVGKTLSTKGLTFTLYTQGMDYVMEKMLTNFNIFQEEVSQSVRSELQKLDEKLQIKKRETLKPEAELHVGFMGIERLFSFNTESYMEAVQKINEMIQSSPDKTGKHISYSKARMMGEIEGVGPTETGFPIAIELTMPYVYSIRASFYSKHSEVPETPTYFPTYMKSNFSVSMSYKSQTVMGVLSPFTKQFIGSGVEMGVHGNIPLDASFTYNKEGQVEFRIKPLYSVHQKEVELVHAIVNPFTFKKSYETISPESHSSGSKTITTGNDMKKYEFNPTKDSLGIDAPISVLTDYKTFDISSLFRRLCKPEYGLSNLQTLSLPTSLRFNSISLKYKPVNSQTKEFHTRFTIAYAKKLNPSESVHPIYPKHLSHHTEIKKMCVENHQSEFEINNCITEQSKSLLSVSDVSHHDREYCHRHVRSEYFPTGTESSQFREEIENCLISAKICEAAKFVCTQKSLSPKICEEKRTACEMRQLNLLKIKTILHKLETGRAYSVGIETSINSHYEKWTSAVSFSGGAKRHDSFVKTLGEVEVSVPNREPYVILSESVTTLPAFKSRWDVEKMIDDEVSIKADMLHFYGRKSTPKSEMKRIVIEAIAEKTESQKRSIRRSDHYTMCLRESGEGRTLSPVCEKVRHAASAVDRLVVKAQFPKELYSKNCPTFSYLHNAAEALFFPHVTERNYGLWSSSSRHTSSPSPSSLPSLSSLSQVDNVAQNEIYFETSVGPESKDLQIKYRHHGFEFDAHNLRLPSYFHNVIPLSLRNGPVYRIIQKSTYQQTPASCKIERDYITTFDNKTYPYTLNDCEHLLVKDCSDLWPLAVTAKGSSGQKWVKIAAGAYVVDIEPIQGSVLHGIKLDGHKVDLEMGQIWIKRSETTGRKLLKIRSYVDGVVEITEYQSGLKVEFDGERIEVIPPQMIKSRACGICGDMNGESTADIITPKMCVFSKPRIAAYTYMIKDSCRGIPEQDKNEYEKENRECVKKDTVITPLADLTERFVKVKSGPNGVLNKHLIEYRANGNEICFSKNVIRVCEGKAIPSIGHAVSVEFTCRHAHNSLTKHIMNRIWANEELPELKKYPTTYTRMIEEVSVCKSPSNGYSSSPSSSSASIHESGQSRHYQPSTGSFQPQIYDY